MAKLQSAIIVDIHNTLIINDNQLNNKLINLINAIGKDYYIILITASYYTSKADLLKSSEAMQSILKIADECYYSKKANLTDDAEIKLDIYNSKIKNNYDVCFVIDNNKDVLKAFRNIGIDTLRFKY